MAATLDLSHEFDSLVKTLQSTPDNPVIKMEIVRRLPNMMALAKTSPIILYRLAQLYSPSSTQYKKMMTGSADGGCTNAMLAICQEKLNAEDLNETDLKTIAHYMVMIESSDDTYIIKQSRALLASCPELVDFMKEECLYDSYKNKNTRLFFRIQPEKNASQQSEVARYSFARS